MSQKNIQINLTFKSDTAAAKQSIAQLQQSLSNLAATPLTSGKTKAMQQELFQATQKAVELKQAIQNATNVDTGKLNFGKLQAQLKANKTSLQQYAIELQKLGPQGVQAFSQLANAIRQSETPLISMQGKIAALGQTMMNTIRWQISASLIQGAMSAFSGVIDYSKELNESLNNIRIVTGKSVEEMGRFADKAQKAAKSLSTTAKDYIDASHIFFQQGLDGKAVDERVAATIKLANATGKSAAEVSEWMTAIWNNFDDGSQSLEYYGDVLAKLGAATASSADEIAGGLEKFSAVADTVGLSYEYAASALATITAETRQSEDVVGTSLKTIFARVENLKLGETLEDGTTLGQYSAALEKVGVNIKDSNGNLKEMDDILDGIGARWEGLNKDEQVALAQSVAGIRQYNQFMALMDNWDVMERNVELAKEANGELEIQQHIYSEGIGGATERVQNALDGIKRSLLNEEDLVPWVNGFADILEFTNKLIDAFGGLKGILTLVASTMLKIYGPQVSAGLAAVGTSLSNTMRTLNGTIQSDRDKAVSSATQIASEMAAEGDMGTQEGVSTSRYLKEEEESARILAEYEGQISAHNKEQLELIHQIVEAKEKAAMTSAIEMDEGAKEYEEGRAALEAQQVRDETGAVVSGVTDEEMTMLENAGEFDTKAETFGEHQYKDVSKMESDAGALVASAESFSDPASEEDQQALAALQARYDELQQSIAEYQAAVEECEQAEAALAKAQASGKKNLDKEKAAVEDATKKRKKLRGEVTKSQKNFSSTAKTINAEEKALKKLGKTNKGAIKDATKMVQGAKKQNKATKDNTKATKEATVAQEKYRKAIKDSAAEGKTWAESLTAGMQTVTQGLSGIMMITGAFDSLSDAIANGEAGFSDYLTATVSVIFGLMQMIPVFATVAKAMQKMKQAQDADTTSKKKGNIFSRIWTKLKKKEGDEAGKAAQKRKQAQQQDQQTDNKEQASNIKTALTRVAKWFAKGPVGWIIGAACIAAIVALIGMSLAKPKAEAQGSEEQQEEANEKVNEGMEKAKENGELIKSYNELLTTYKETGEGKEDLAKAAEELAAAYNIEGAALAALTGDYDNFTKAVQEARKKELNQLSSDADNAIALGRQGFEDAMREGTGHKESDGSYHADFSTGSSMSDEAAVMEAAKEYKKAHPNASWLVIGDNGNVDVKLKDMSAENFAMAYEGIQEITNRARELGDTQDSEMYNDMIGWLSKSSEEYEKYKQNNSARVYADAELDVLNTTTSSGQGISDITDLSTYLDYADDVLTDENNQTFTGEEYDARVEALGTYATNPQFEVIRKAIADQGAMAEEKGAKFDQDWLKEQYKGSSDARQRALAMTEITAGMSENEFLQAVEQNMEKGARASKIDIAKQYEVTEKQADAFTSVLKKQNSELGQNGTLLEIVSANVIQLNGEMDKLTSVWQSNSKALLSNNTNTVQYAQALSDVSNQFGALLGTDADLTGFVEANKNAISDFMNGNVAIFSDLSEAAARYVASTYTDVENVQFLFDELNNDDYTIGESVNIDGFKDKMQALLTSGELTKTELQKIFSMQGFELEIDGNGIITTLTKVKDESMIATDAMEELWQKRLDNVKKLNKEIDKYYVINEVTDDITRAMDRLGKAKERAYGKDKIALINAEAKAHELAAQAETKRAKQLKKDIEKEGNDLKNKYGANISNSGNITNYTEIQARLAQNMANIADMDSQAYKDAQQKYEDFKKLAEDYEKHQDEYEDSLDKRQEEELAAIDARFEAAQYTVEINVEVNDRQLSVLERKLAQMEDDDDYTGADRNVNRASQVDEHQQNIGRYTTGISDTLKASGATDAMVREFINGDANAIMGLDLSADQIKYIQDCTASIAEEQDAIIDLTKAIEEETLAAYDKWQTEMEETNERLDNSVTIAENYKNIVELMGKDSLGVDEAGLRAMEDAQMKAVDAKMKTAKEQMEFARTSLEQIEKDIAQARTDGNDELVKTLTEQQEYLSNDLIAKEAAFTTAWSESLQTAADIFQAQMERTFDDLDDRLAGSFSSLSELSKSYSQQQTIANRYLDNGEKLYELSKLNRKIQQDIDKSTNVKAQRELAELQEMINAYEQDGVKMSKADLDALQKRYDLKVAEIALEEAQNAKTQIRLTRNSEGGMSYVYTANQTKTDQAQQKYEDALEANRKLAEQQSNDLTSQIISNRQAMVEALRAIRREDYVDAEAYQKALEETAAYYTGQEAYLIDEKNKVIARSQITYAEDYLAYEGWSGQVMDRSAMLRETLANDYNSMGQNSLGWVTTFGDHIEEMIGKYEAVASTATSLCNLLGKGTETGGTGIYGDMVLGAAGWVSGLGKATSTAAAQYPLISQAVTKVDTTLGTGEVGSTGTYGLLLAHAASYDENLRLELGKSNGIYAQVSAACDLCDETLGDGNKGSNTSYAYMLTHAETFGGNLATELAKAGGAFDNVLNGTASTTGAQQMLETLGSVTEEGSIFYQSNQNALEWQGKIDLTMQNAGVSMDQVRQAAKDKLNGDDSAATEMKTFNRTIQDEMYGPGGTKDKPTGGVTGAIKAVESEVTQMATDAEREFKATANSATTHLPTLYNQVDKNEKRIEDLNDALDRLDDYKVTAEADVDVNGTDDLKKLNEQLSKLAEELDELTSGTINISIKKTVVSEVAGDVKTPAAAFSKGDYVQVNEMGPHQVGYVAPKGAITQSRYDEKSRTWQYMVEGKNQWYSESQLKETFNMFRKTWSSSDPYYATLDKDTSLLLYTTSGSIYGAPTIPKGTKVTIGEAKKAATGKWYFQLKTNNSTYPGPYVIDENNLNTLINQEDGFGVNGTFESQFGVGNIYRWSSTFDTGGYTGEWGPDGRMAILHQKEIVLNAHDTENLLQTVDIVRSIASQLDLNALSMVQSLGALTASTKLIFGGAQRLEQTVHITAEFPNATDRNEISAAFGDIVNLAAQYANRK